MIKDAAVFRAGCFEICGKRGYKRQNNPRLRFSAPNIKVRYQANLVDAHGICDGSVNDPMAAFLMMIAS
jgi:hypothetical protein